MVKVLQRKTGYIFGLAVSASSHKVPHSGLWVGRVWPLCWAGLAEGDEGRMCVFSNWERRVAALMPGRCRAANREKDNAGRHAGRPTGKKNDAVRPRRTDNPGEKHRRPARRTDNSENKRRRPASSPAFVAVAAYQCRFVRRKNGTSISPSSPSAVETRRGSSELEF